MEMGLEQEEAEEIVQLLHHQNQEMVEGMVTVEEKKEGKGEGISPKCINIFYSFFSCFLQVVPN
jgi:hypothetical protein